MAATLATSELTITSALARVMVRRMLLERDEPLRILAGLVHGLGETGGKLVLIRGEAGIGKSAIVNAFAEAHARDAHVLTGACDDLFIPQPLGPFWDIARFEPTVRAALVASDRPGLLDAVLDLLSRRPRPTILIIDDTHWADEATLDAIRYIGRRITRTNGLLVLTYRDGDVDQEHPLRGVIGDIPTQSVMRIQLGGLSLEAVTTIVGGSGLIPTDVYRATQGNPFLVTEMAAATGAGATGSLVDALMARVRKLTIASQEMLKTLSVIPEPLPAADALRLAGVDPARLEECQQRGLLDPSVKMIAFRHDLIRRTIESALTPSERLARNRLVLDGLPEATHSCLLIHCAVAASDIDRLLDLAPRSARYAAAMGSHVQAAEDFRQVGPYLDRISLVSLGPLLDEWAAEEFLVDDVASAIRLSGLAREHYRAMADAGAESRALARAAHYHENAGQRDRAEELAREAIEVLGANPPGADLARALEVNAYLQMMAGNTPGVLDLVDRTLAAGGPGIDEAILIRSLNHRGIVANIANYPDGRASLDEARERATAAGQWYEECRAILNHAWAAIESQDLPTASDYAQRAIASAVRHELRTLESYTTGLYTRALELEGAWDRAADLARELLASNGITQMLALPVLGVIDARRGKASAGPLLERAWEQASVAGEFQRLAPAAIAMAEHAWISGASDVPSADITHIMHTGIGLGFRWSPGKLAFWLWKLGELSKAPEGIAEPYRLVIEGRATDAAAIWAARGIPYERALALMHGTPADELEALEGLETLGATAVAARLRKALRDRGVPVPRGRGRETRANAAGLTARQAEILGLLSEGLSTTEIADRLFISPRTVENHVAAVLDKLDVATRDDAVAWARTNGFPGVIV